MAPGGLFSTLSFFKYDSMEEESQLDDGMQQQQQQHIQDEFTQQQCNESLLRSTRPTIFARQAFQQAQDRADKLVRQQAEDRAAEVIQNVIRQRQQDQLQATELARRLKQQYRSNEAYQVNRLYDQQQAVEMAHAAEAEILGQDNEELLEQIRVEQELLTERLQEQ